jgi:hypothetical protein
MKTTFGLVAVFATLLLFSGCNGLHGKDRPTRDPVRLPGAPALEGSPTNPTSPMSSPSPASPAISGITGSAPMVPPARSVGSN